MAISVMVELRAKSGRGAELESRLGSEIATQGPDQHGFLGRGTGVDVEATRFLMAISSHRRLRAAGCWSGR
jgi:hypothetical protein